MTERLADIGTRIHNIGQLGAVVNAMRGIAAARAQQARAQLDAVDSYAALIAAAIECVLPTTHSDTPDSKVGATRLAVVVFCAEQGFAGAFSERVIDAVGIDVSRAEIFLIGTRGQVAIAARGISPGWTCAMPSHSQGIPALADRIVQALYARIAKGDVDRLDVIFSRWSLSQSVDVQRRTLFPFDTTAIGTRSSTIEPLFNLSQTMVLEALTEEYMLAELCQAALHAFAAENEARMEAMAAARTQVQRQLSELQAMQRRVRQEEITAEIIELAAGETASRRR